MPIQLVVWKLINQNKNFDGTIDIIFDDPYLMEQIDSAIVNTINPFRVDDDMLGHLDKLENHPTSYTRTAQEFEIISSSNGGDIKAGDVIKGGIYLLKNFKEKLLQLPCLETYEDQAYVKP